MIGKIESYSSWILAVVLLVNTACSTVAYKPSINYFGDVDVEKSEAAAEKAAELPLDRNYPVRIIEGQIPEGLDSTEGGTKIVVLKGHETKYQVLGEIESKPKYGAGELTVRKFLWMWDMHPDEGALDGYCKWQGPLRAVTVSLWNYTPFNWPCFFSSYPKQQKDARRIHIRELKRGAYAMGANLVIITNSTNFGTVYLGSGGQAYGRTTDFQEFSLRGFVIIDRTAAPRAPAAQGTVTPAAAGVRPIGSAIPARKR
jgi:hypothetical protein